MDSTVVQYIVFIIVALLLIWAVIGLNRYIYRRAKISPDSPQNWVELDIKRPEAREEPSLSTGDRDEENENENEEEAEMHARAKQNGHHAESQKPQI